MPLEIGDAAIKKLCHNIPEIRIRSLKSIESKFHNAIRQNENISFNAALLMKWLIRWFGQQVQCDESDRVLGLMLQILKSKYGKEAVITLGHSKLSREVQKIKTLLTATAPENKILLHHIEEVLAELYTKNDLSVDIDIPLERHQSKSAEPKDILDMDLLTIVDETTSFAHDDFLVNFVEIWEKPCASDMNSIKLLKSSLRSDTEEANVQHALQFLNVAINDFPAEYFLQPPYIFFSLKSLIDKKNHYATEVLQKFSHLTRAFRKRLTMRNLSKIYCPDNRNNDSNLKSPRKTQISVEKYFYDLFRTNLDYFRDLIDMPDCQDDINKSFCLMQDLMDLLQFSTRNSTFNFLDDILNDLGNTAKFLRQTWMNSAEPESHRNHYIILLSIICQMASLKGGPHFPRKPYEPTEFTSFSINSSQSKHIQNTTETMSTNSASTEHCVWLQELEIACYDYSIQQFYNDIYNRMSNIVQLGGFSVQKQCSLALTNAVDLLKRSSIEYDNITLLSKGSLAMDTMSLHKSLELTKKLLVTIIKCVPYFEGNDALQLNAENLFLRILSHEDISIKRNAFRICAEKMKYYFSSLMDGAQILHRSSVQTQTHFLGVPLTVDILIEIICFGCAHQESNIRENANAMVSLILRSRTMLDRNWQCIWEILMPVMPLIECYASKLTDLGKTVIEFFDPDNVYCSFLEIFKGNVRLLFNTEATVRDEAVARLLYMLLSHEQADSYLPNINNISDIIPNSVCLIKSPYDPQKVAALQSGTYDTTSMRPLIELLECNDVEPSVRKATFTQLNVMVQDPQLNDILNQENGLFLVLQALQNSIKTEHHKDYPDTAIPVVGIIAKLCVQYPKFRKEVSQEINVFCLLVRALVLFYHHESFKQDCAVALFLLVFSDYTMGCTQISLPTLCDRLEAPIKYTSHWTTSPFNKKSDLEQLLLNINDTDQSNGTWQYVRLTFANLWFGGLEHIFDKSQGTKIDYDADCCFEFDQSLRLTKTDVLLLRATSISLTLHNRLQTITNATNHLVAQSAIAGLSNYMLLPSTDTLRRSSKDLLTAVRRFCSITPNTHSDDATFTAVSKLLADLVQKDFYEVQIWILEELRQKNCSYSTILNGNIVTTPKLFSSNCRFLGVILQCSMQSTNSKVQDLLSSPMESHRSLLAYLFDVMVKQLDEHYTKRELDKLRALLTLMRIVTLPIYRNYLEYDDDEFVGYVANKLLHLIAVVKSLAQAGSNFNKNCLMTVGNLMAAASSIEEVKINSKYVKLLSGLCGHAEIQIRATSWSILTELSRTLNGAAQLVKELAYLPGGFHACCLSTFMDPYEASVVRETAGCLFANLLKFRSGIRQLPIAVTPICSENNPNTPDEDAISLVIEILMRQRFFTCLSNAFKSYWPHDIIDHDAIGPVITTCDIIRTYCAILLNLITLQPNIVTDLHANGIVFDMFRVIPSVVQTISRSALLMFVEICNFMVSCVSYEPEILSQITMQEYAVVSTLLSSLDQSVYDEFGSTLGVKCILSSVLLLDAVTGSSNGTQQICHLISEDVQHLEHLLQLVQLGSQMHKQHPDLSESILRLFGKLLTMSLVSENSDRYDSTGHTFANLLDNNSTNSQEPYYLAEQNDELDENYENRNSNQSNHSPHRQIRKTTMAASQLLFQMLADFMPRVRSQPTLSEPTITVMYLLLKCSHLARATATENGFLRVLLKELDDVHATFGMACSEFIRRHADSKKEPILTVIRNLYNVILNWYSADVILSEKDAQDMCRLSMKLWPWIGTNQRLQVIYMRSLTFLSEDSVLMCKVMSTCHPTTGTTSTILQHFVAYILAETSRAKHPLSDLLQLQLAMRIVSNCCSCIEGRMLLMKMNVLDSLNRLHPSITKLQKPWVTITTMWLRLFDILTRYSDPNVGVRHLSLLCTFVLKSTLRLQALVVMRNMSFSVANRAALLASDEFMYAMKSVLETGTISEQLLAITSIWKLIANSYKAKHSIRSSSILTKIRELADRMQVTDANDKKSTELIDVLDIVVTIFSK